MSEITNPFEKGKGSIELGQIALQVERAMFAKEALSVAEALMILEAARVNILLRVFQGGFHAPSNNNNQAQS